MFSRVTNFFTKVYHSIGSPNDIENPAITIPDSASNSLSYFKLSNAAKQLAQVFTTWQPTMQATLIAGLLCSASAIGAGCLSAVHRAGYKPIAVKSGSNLIKVDTEQPEYQDYYEDDAKQKLSPINKKIRAAQQKLIDGTRLEQYQISAYLDDQPPLPNPDIATIQAVGKKVMAYLNKAGIVLNKGAYDPVRNYTPKSWGYQPTSTQNLGQINSNGPQAIICQNGNPADIYFNNQFYHSNVLSKLGLPEVPYADWFKISVSCPASIVFLNPKSKLPEQKNITIDLRKPDIRLTLYGNEANSTFTASFLAKSGNGTYNFANMHLTKEPEIAEREYDPTFDTAHFPWNETLLAQAHQNATTLLNKLETDLKGLVDDVYKIIKENNLAIYKPELEALVKLIAAREELKPLFKAMVVLALTAGISSAIAILGAVMNEFELDSLIYKMQPRVQLQVADEVAPEAAVIDLGRLA